MMKFIPKSITTLIFSLILLSSCNFETPTEFSKEALNDRITTLNGKSTAFKEIINQYKGKKVLIDIWASWCADCIKGLPNVKKLQKKFPEVVFLFLSVDKNNASWKRGITRFRIKGEHYNLPKGMKDGDFVDFVNSSWIPRYMVVDEEGKIKLFKATRSSDNRIVEALKN